MIKTRHLTLKKWAIALLVILVVAIGLVGNNLQAISTTASALPISISIRDINKSIYPTNWYLDANLSNGLWYEDVSNPLFSGSYRVSYVKIYSLGSTLRVMEISTYPRAYQDTTLHVYSVDTQFTVTEPDLNYYDENGKRWYQDTRGGLYALGVTATHWKGDPLPGSFPLWIASESLPTPTTEANYDNFPLVVRTMIGQLSSVTLYESYWRRSNITTWTKVNSTIFSSLSAQLASGKLRIPRLGNASQRRIIVRIIYDRFIKKAA